MEYKYFAQTKVGYQLKKNKNTFYFILSLFGTMAIFALYYAIVNNTTAGFIFAFLFIFIIILFNMLQKRHQLFINPELKTITVKIGRKMKKYSFDKFIGFKESKIVISLIITQTAVFMHFRGNKKDEYVFLDITIWQRKINQLTLETINIMNLSEIDSV